MNYLNVLEVLSRMERKTKQIEIEEQLIFYKRNSLKQKSYSSTVE